MLKCAQCGAYVPVSADAECPRCYQNPYILNRSPQANTPDARSL